jgi:hypothetical protein
MVNITIKLAELRRRVVELESQINLHLQQTALLEGRGRRLWAAIWALAVMWKQLSSSEKLPILV